MNSTNGTIDTQLTTTTKMPIQRPRLVVELNDGEFNHLLRMIAVKNRSTVRAVVLQALADKHPELKQAIKKELG